ncbi:MULTISPECIES: SDR family oxidoreductase [Halobacillus]|uniref:SDR family oxidoreductase n=1 Tax=Halobacillus TaxID=45667 RepID=UPI00136E6D6C|nr:MULTISPECIES: SDR family oxidoreductase [Halobacillus]MYL29954.1 NAD(P)H-binding protein [Halobacillus halophilus]MYL37582.1 NAD(P)H-binding protein [Halobacillus litoralis]
MKVLVVGANGQVGKHLVQKIQSHHDIEAVAMIRKEEQASYFKDLGAETVLVDLEDNTEKMAEAFDDVDAVVFTAGSGPNTGPDKTVMIDLDGAVKTIEAAKQKGVNRYVMVSSFDTTREAIQGAPASFAPYVVAKHYADDWLRRTNLNYTIVHPGILTNEDGTGQVQAAETVERGEISREDVAGVLLAVLENESTIGKEFQVVGGSTSIKDAVNKL